MKIENRAKNSYNINEFLPNNQVETYRKDGRKKIEDLYSGYFELLTDSNWEMKKIIDSKTLWDGREVSFPLLCFMTKKKGSAIYLLSGIHGEEPTGPNAISESIDSLKIIGQNKPIVMMPLLNPLGYFRNWRYLNKEKYTDDPEIEGQSVGDSEHLLLDNNNSMPRRKMPANRECAALSDFILKTSKDYPPQLSLDFHGDVLVPKGYLYSQGKKGDKDDLAPEILMILEKNGVPIQWEGKTRFGEDINNGIIGKQSDGSIDELISASHVFMDNKIQSGPNAEKVFVLETPDADIPLEKRVKAYKAVIEFIAEKSSKSNPE